MIIGAVQGTSIHQQNKRQNDEINRKTLRCVLVKSKFHVLSLEAWPFRQRCYSNAHHRKLFCRDRSVEWRWCWAKNSKHFHSSVHFEWLIWEVRGVSPRRIAIYRSEVCDLKGKKINFGIVYICILLLSKTLYRKVWISSYGNLWDVISVILLRCSMLSIFIIIIEKFIVNIEKNHHKKFNKTRLKLFSISGAGALRQ